MRGLEEVELRKEEGPGGAAGVWAQQGFGRSRGQQEQDVGSGQMSSEPKCYGPVNAEGVIELGFAAIADPGHEPHHTQPRPAPPAPSGPPLRQSAVGLPRDVLRFSFDTFNTFFSLSDHRHRSCSLMAPQT